MSQFHYEAYSASGRPVTGVVEAETMGQALAELARQGLKPYKTSSEAETRRTSFNDQQTVRLGLPLRARLIRQLATLLAAGMPPDRALRILAAQIDKPTVRRIIEAIQEQVVAGRSLAVAMGNASSAFKADEVGLVQAGEHTGSLPSVLHELATLLERRVTLREKLTSSMVYPAFLLAMVPATLIIIAVVLVPNLKPLFENSGAPMPIVLRLLMAASDQIAVNGLIWLVLAALLAVLVASLSRNPAIRSSFARLFTSIPGARTIARKTEAARICRTLSSLLRSGAALQTAMAVTAEVSAKDVTREQLGAARDGVAQGERLGRALARVPSLDANILQMIAIGEETNRLDAMLLYVADQEEQAVANALDRFMALLTPILTVAIGLLVGGIVMSIMRAILSINDLAAP